MTQKTMTRAMMKATKAVEINPLKREDVRALFTESHRECHLFP